MMINQIAVRILPDAYAGLFSAMHVVHGLCTLYAVSPLRKQRQPVDPVLPHEDRSQQHSFLSPHWTPPFPFFSTRLLYGLR